MGIKKGRISCCFNSDEKFCKKCKKSYQQKCDVKIFTSSTFTHVRQTCFAYNFFGTFLKTFSTDFKSA